MTLIMKLLLSIWHLESKHSSARKSLIEMCMWGWWDQSKVGNILRFTIYKTVIVALNNTRGSVTTDLVGFCWQYIKIRMKKISAILRKRFTAPNWVKVGIIYELGPLRKYIAKHCNFSSLQHKEPREVHMFVDLLLQEVIMCFILAFIMFVFL